MSSSSNIAIRLMNQTDYNEVLALLLNSFFPDEPISKSVQVINVSEFGKILIDACMPDQCSFVAYDVETNRIIAVCLNEIMNKNISKPIETTDEQIRFVLQIFYDLDTKKDLFEILNTDTLLHVFVITVDKRVRRQNLATRLISESIEYAATKLNLSGAYAEATSVYSLNCCKRQQFQIFDELIYVDYNAKYLASLTDKMYDRCYLVGRKF